ncbi:daptide-type RiPP [Priestia endophytica]|uniref:daptide-type RiPP n=1 Tax=Priestia endophytica TaxID=135735 RepID=UPI002E1E4AC4|nr:hypothetical protein [Priestia endophytica]
MEKIYINQSNVEESNQMQFEELEEVIAPGYWGGFAAGVGVVAAGVGAGLLIT